MRIQSEERTPGRIFIAVFARRAVVSQYVALWDEVTWNTAINAPELEDAAAAAVLAQGSALLTPAVQQPRAALFPRVPLHELERRQVRCRGQ